MTTAPVDYPDLLPGRNAPFWRQEDPEFDDEGRIRLGGMFEHQREWWALPNFVKLLVGGYGCVCGHTLVEGVPIAERSEWGLVRTMAGPSWATPAYCKGRARLYRVRTVSGREVVVTNEHRFLSTLGWRTLLQLGPGCSIAAAPEDPSAAPVWDEIESVTFDRVGQFYDLHVPGLEHYEAHGLWHHNSGKSFVLCKRASGIALTNAPCPVAVVSPSFPIAKRTTIATFRELFRGKETLLGKYGFSWKENKTDHVFHVGYLGRTAEIQIYTGDNPDALKGPNLSAAYIDEPFIQDQAVFDQMVARVRHPKAKIREIALTGTPEQLNWGYDLCEGELGDRYDVGFIRAATNLNRSLPDEYFERLLEGFDEKAREAYLFGHFVNLTAGLVYYGFMPEENVVDMRTPDGVELGCGMDFNVDPMSAVVFWRRGEHVHVFEEIELPNADTEYMCSVLREKYPDLVEVYPDASGKSRATNAPGGVSDFDIIRKAGFEVNARSANPKRRDRYNAVNARFRPHKGRVRLTISPSCKKLIRYLQAYSHGEMNKPAQKAMSHALDALGYPIAYLFPLDRRPARTIGVLGH